MRIALYHNLPSGGAKRAVYEWTRRLGVSHAVDVYTLSTANHAFCDIRPYVQNHYTFDFVPHQLFVSPFGRLNRFQGWRDLGKLKRIGQSIAREIDDRGYDVLFTHPCSFTFIPALLSFAQVPSLYYLHEPFGPTFQRQFQRPYLKAETNLRRLSKLVDPLYQIYKARLEAQWRKSIAHTNLLLANSRFTQDSMHRSYGVDAPVCYYGVDSQTFRPLSGIQRENRVVSVGELTPRKGFDFLVHSLGYIPQDERPALTLICNQVDLNEKSYIEYLASSNGVQLNILSNLNSEQLCIEYNRARVCVYAPIAEPLGLVPLESMACGTPVVGVAEAGVTETVRDRETGLLTARDPALFADAVLALMRDHSLAESLGRKGVDYVRNSWSWDDSTSRLIAFLQSVAAQTVA